MKFITDDIAGLICDACKDCDKTEECVKKSPIPHKDCQITWAILGIIATIFIPIILFIQVIYYAIKQRKEY